MHLLLWGERESSVCLILPTLLPAQATTAPSRRHCRATESRSHVTSHTHKCPSLHHAFLQSPRPPPFREVLLEKEESRREESSLSQLGE